MAAVTRGSDTTNKQIQVFWSPVDGDSAGQSTVTNYKLQKYNDASTLWEDLTGASSNFLGTSYTLTGLSEGQQV